MNISFLIGKIRIKLDNLCNAFSNVLVYGRFFIIDNISITNLLFSSLSQNTFVSIEKTLWLLIKENGLCLKLFQVIFICPVGNQTLRKLQTIENEAITNIYDI